MTFKCFCVMPYSKKLQLCNNAFHSLLKRQAKVNHLLNILRHQPKMQEIFKNILELNNMLRQTCVNLFKANFSSEHEFHGMISSPKRLGAVSVDVCNLLEYLANVPKTDADMDLLFLTAHSVKKNALIRFWKLYYIQYDWVHIFSSKAPSVSNLKYVQPKYNFTYFTSKQLKAKFKEQIF